MINVRLFFAASGKPAIKSGISEGFIVVSGLKALQRGDGFDAHTKEIVRESLKERKGLGSELAIFSRDIRRSLFSLRRADFSSRDIPAR